MTARQLRRAVTFPEAIPYRHRLTLVEDTPADSWEDNALCREVDPELFYPEYGEDSAAEGKQVCARCTVRAECLDAALARGEEHGTWGGLSQWERNKIKRDFDTTTTEKAA